jgi:hypothetical protein
MLTLLVEPRKTLQTFLDDIRQIRNSITVQKTLSSAQIQLLDNYYAQIARPVQRAFEEGERASIRPDSWRWMPANCIPSGKRRRKWIGSPVGICLRSVTPLKSRPSARRVPRTTRAAHFRCAMGAVGVMVIAIVAGLLAGDQQQTAACNRSAAEAAPPQEMRETPSSRETLTRMGVTGTRIISARPLTATTPA